MAAARSSERAAMGLKRDTHKDHGIRNPTPLRADRRPPYRAEVRIAERHSAERDKSRLETDARRSQGARTRDSSPFSRRRSSSRKSSSIERSSAERVGMRREDHLRKSRDRALRTERRSSERVSGRVPGDAVISRSDRKHQGHEARQAGLPAQPRLKRSRERSQDKGVPAKRARVDSRLSKASDSQNSSRRQNRSDQPNQGGKVNPVPGKSLATQINTQPVSHYACGT